MAVIETHTFRLRAGADEEAFLQTDKLVQTAFIANQPGFVRRTTARGIDREWIVIVLWRSDADATAAAAVPHDSVAAFAGFTEAVATKRYTTLD
ncbi:MAG: hypothetical protein H0W70_04555 [Actinobacteria bacterium]|nr:hypothetical protein [Actinomycetota bacterium]